MFTKTARFYDTIYAAQGKNYQREAQLIANLARELLPNGTTLLDAACGTGAHLQHFARWFEAGGFDKDVEMVVLARACCPELEIEPCDLLDAAWPRACDIIVCLFGSIAYVRTLANLQRVVGNLRSLLAPAGVLFVEPFIAPDRFTAGRLNSVFVDEPDLKIARMNLSKRLRDLAILDFHYLVASKTGVERYFERHEVGLFTQADYRTAFGAAGLSFDVRPGVMSFERDLYIGSL